MPSSGRGNATNNSILQFILGQATYTAPAGCYAGLFSTVPTSDNDAGTELVAGTNAYARAVIHATNQPAAWSAVTQDATGAHKTNSGAITFPTATPGAWLPAAGYGIWSAATAGTLLYWGTFGSPTTVGASATASFAANALTITEA